MSNHTNLRIPVSLILVILLFLCYSVSAQETVKARLEKLNSIFIAASINRNVDERMKYYAPDAVSMPEYQPMLKGIDAIKQYYREIFRRQQVKTFTKEITEIIDLEEMVFEAGIFKTEFINVSDNSPVIHKGKYINVWKRGKGGLLQLQSEAWSYFHHIENPSALVVRMTGRNIANDPVRVPETSVSFELKALNALMEKTVQSRDGNLQAEFYTEDGIYMPFADTMKVGKDKIRQHLIGYNSGQVIIDSIRVYADRFIPLGAYVIEYAKFYVKWRIAGSSGITQGKGTRLWKRMPDCSLKLHRQIGMHDEVVE